MAGSDGPAQAPTRKSMPSTRPKGIRNWMSRRIGRLTTWWRKLSENAKRILAGYAIVFVFFITFFVLAALGSNRLPSLLGGTSVLLLLSLFAVLPPLVEFLRPVVSTVKVGILEVSFREFVKRTEVLIEQLREIDMAVQDNLMYMAKDNWRDILRELDRLNESNAEVVRVDLGSASKRTWKFPNLYFFALLLDLQSGVRHLLFLHKRDDGYDEFITMCRPSHLRQDLEKLSPLFGIAASDWRKAQADSVEGVLTRNTAFNAALTGALEEARREWSGVGKNSNASGPQPGYVDGWVEPQDLLRVLGTHTNFCRIRPKERLTRDDYRAILGCSDRYVPVIEDGSLVFLLDRDRVALDIAREAT